MNALGVYHNVITHSTNGDHNVISGTGHHNVDGACLWQGRQDLNPRPIALKATILPTELLPLICHTGSSYFVVLQANIRNGTSQRNSTALRSFDQHNQDNLS